MQVQPYLFFEGRCQEAIDFYSRSIGATVRMQMHSLRTARYRRDATRGGMTR